MYSWGMDWGTSLAGVNDIALVSLLIFALSYLFFGLDDLFIDIIAYFRGLFPRTIASDSLENLKKNKQKKIAVMVPAWNEGNIIKRMLVGNLNNIDYENIFFFIGCYPNDPDTIKEVQKVGEIDKRVVPVINYKEGPTTKGQILNFVVKSIFEFEKAHNMHFDVFLMQDSEDLIHSLTPALVNKLVDKYSYIQVPVFSLPVGTHQLVAGTYMDEFAESHTKDLLVREYLGAAIPSAGVGTALSRELVLGILKKQNGNFLNETSVTEDYELGINAKGLGFKPHFACYRYRDMATNRFEYIATREYFPKKLFRSIKQKTRWTVGIAFQGWGNLGWQGSFFNKYFLYRDRRGPYINILSLFGYAVMAWVLGYSLLIDGKPLGELAQIKEVQGLLIANFVLMANRLIQRMVCTYRIYGASITSLAVLRWPFSIFINAMAGMRAIKQITESKIKQKEIKWATTDHELPANFGEVVEIKRG